MKILSLTQTTTRWRWLLATVPVGGLMLAAVAAPPKKTIKPAPKAGAAVDDARFERDVRPLLVKYCLPCHTGSGSSGGANMAPDKTLAAVLKNRKLWERVIANTTERTMPPAGMPQPTLAERDKLAGTLQALITQADCQLNDPGRVTLRRLNRAEYNNTVRDLLGVDLRPADNFPSDDVGYGFDNIGDVLSLSPLLMEKYMATAERLSRTAIVAPEDRNGNRRLVTGAALSGAGAAYEGTAREFASNGDAGFDYEFPAAGDFTIVVRAWGHQAGPDPCRMRIKVGDAIVQDVAVRNKNGDPGTFSATIAIDKPGKQRVSVGFLNDYYVPSGPDPKLVGDRNLMVENVEVRPPDSLAGKLLGPLPETHRKLLTTRPTESTDESWNRASRALLRPIARRAFRRPVTEPELDRLVRVTRLAKEQKQSFERGMQLGVQAILVSPSFLFRPEIDARPDDRNAHRALTDYELATRLSYFLWSSMPDDELLDLAAAGKLKDTTVLVAQAKRMLRDPRSKALADNFAGQWLQLRSIGVVQPDTKTFPAFNDSLRQAMRTETEMYFQFVVREDRPILEFLDSDYTFLNETLAKHYGNETVTGPEFRKVALTGDQRGGLLGQASILTVTSNPTRTSPVKRGKWVLENFFNTPPPPPPPNVPQLDDPNKGPITAKTVRERLELHRSNPACASCHARMDGIGFALENYDAIGAWRTVDDNKANLDITGALPDGSRFTGPSGLRSLLLARKGMFTRALTERLLTYALGRGLLPTDHCNVDAMAKRVSDSNYRFSALVASVVSSKPFRERRGDEAGGAAAQVAAPAAPKPTEVPKTTQSHSSATTPRGSASPAQIPVARPKKR